MSSVQTTTLGDVGRWVGRFGPYLALVTVVSVVVGLAPGGSPQDGDALDSLAAGGGTQAGALPQQAAVEGAAPATDGGTAAAEPGAAPGGPGVARTSTGSGDAAAPSESGSDGTGTRSGPAAAKGAAPAPGTALPAGTKSPKSCDPKTGRVRMPSFHVERCVPGFDGDNGGATARGVTATSIKVAVYIAQPDPAAQAIAQAGGSDDSPAEVRKQYQEWIDLFASQYELHGRKVELVFVEGSGAATDDAAARADALKVVQLGAFASFNSPNTTYSNELAARGILCIQCAIDAPAEYYAEKAPYVYAYGMSSTWQSVHVIEMVEKYLEGKKAAFAGDPLMRDKPRTFGLIAYDTAQGDYKKAHDFFVREMKRRGIPLAVDAVYNGYPDTAKSQQQARPIIQKMKAAGVTTILFSGDPFAPIFFTGEATRQQYFPEWNGNGPLVDTAFFARLYDQQQWRNAFGQSSSTARLPKRLDDSDRLLNWYYGRGPTAAGTYKLIRLPVGMFLAGVHYAGDELTPQTYAAGQFRQPVRPGGISYAALSYGTKLWPLPDYTGIDDKTFIFWDADEPGEDEIGGRGVGLYRYVNGGARYLPGKYPATMPLFRDAGSVTLYADYPKGERPPDYPRPAR